MINVTIWNEYGFEGRGENTAHYPNGMHGALQAIFKDCADISTRIALQHEPECGLSEEVLSTTDVLIWWAHETHHLVPDEISHRVREHVLKGMGFIALHSAHLSKPLRDLLGTSCTLSWCCGDSEKLWTIAPAHPIARGVPQCVFLPQEEMYGEVFDIPAPDELVFIGSFGGGEVFRSGCVWNRGYGKVFYFQPGHESYPIYNDENIRTIIRNAVQYLYPVMRRGSFDCPMVPRS